MHSSTTRPTFVCKTCTVIQEKNVLTCQKSPTHRFSQSVIRGMFILSPIPFSQNNDIISLIFSSIDGERFERCTAAKRI